MMTQRPEGVPSRDQLIISTSRTAPHREKYLSAVECCACRVGFEGHYPRRIRPYQTQPGGACRTRVVALPDYTQPQPTLSANVVSHVVRRHTVVVHDASKRGQLHCQTTKRSWTTLSANVTESSSVLHVPRAV